MTKQNKRLIIIGIVIIVVVFLGYKYWSSKRFALPDGFAYGNGRVEAKRVDIVAKEALRVKEIFVDEGDLVKPGQVLVKLDTVTLEAELAESKANVLAAQERLAITESAIVRKKSEVELAKIEVERARKLLEERAGSQREYDVRKTSVETNMAGLAEEEAKLKTVKQEIEVAKANVDVVQTRIDDATLISPVRGRVLYRLAEVGEVLGAGGKALTLVNLSDIYMEIFLPSEQAAKLKIGAEGRITADFAPGWAAPAHVSFVSPESQFTPKQVETRSEREKLMFRVKLQIPKELIVPYIDRIKTGIRGVGYVKLDDKAQWPKWLQSVVKPPVDNNNSSAEVEPNSVK
ncbi:MAG: HlyD family efflux transporter periplasmic adaptor subunit [Phycisphaerales bacterium]